MERLFPAHRDRAWSGARAGGGRDRAPRGVPLGYGESFRGPAGQQLAAGALVLALVGAAVLTRRPGRRLPRPRRVRPRLVGTIAFAGTGAHFVLTYTVPATGLPWPVGTALALAPIAGAAALLRPRTATGDAYGPVGLRIVVGVLSFFVVLGAAVGLAGRYDLTLAALATALALRHLTCSTPRPGPAPVQPAGTAPGAG